VGVASCDAHAPSRRERGTGIQEQHAHRVDARTLDARVSRRSDVFLTTRFVALGEDDGVSRMERRRRGRDRRGHDRQDAESRAARRIERLASSFFRLDATRATPPRVVECHPWWFVSLRCQLGLKISEALRDEGNELAVREEHPNRVSQRSPRAFPEAGAMGATATFGRVLFAFVFIASALNKLSSLAEGGEMLDSVSPRLAVARRALARKVGIDPLFFAGDGSLVLVATLMELAGAALFVADFALGAKLLMLFILLVTPIMHPFWAAYPDAHTERAVDMIMFFKNASLFGALLVYLEMKPTLEAMKPKSKRR
jgi:hypothetical protein